MSRHPSSDLKHGSTKDNGSVQSNPKEDDTSRMVNSSDLVLDIVPLSIVPDFTPEEARTLNSKAVKISGKSPSSMTKKLGSILV